MFEYELKYNDFFGNEKTDKLRFNLSETELNNLAIDSPIFNIDFLQFMVADANVAAMFKVIQTLLLESYGVMSEDGRTFEKTEKLKNDFRCSAAFDALINKMLNTDDTSLVQDFIIGIFPSKFSEALKDRLANPTKEIAVVG